MAARGMKMMTALLLCAAFAFLGNQLATFVAPSGAGRLTATKISDSGRQTKTVVYAEDPLDFVGKTGKKIEANSQNEQLIDLDGFWAIFYLVLGVGATFLFMNTLQGLRPQ
eukprot:gb/GFBE01039123.1/.p1 GENE.gb/GFBE01039123.1/~~gb/GFBE01039123.1/.p1  ORF type:complete len:111 (+),score=34.64 gb/GFBE01039123.1/:1-333(+)